MVRLPDLQEGSLLTLKEAFDLGMHDDVNLGTIASSYSTETVIGQKFFGERDHEIVLEYRTGTASQLGRQMAELHGLLTPHPDHLARIERIRERLLNGETAWPVIIFKDKKDFMFETCKIREGNHRIVAHALIGSPSIPVFIMRYSFDPI
jgi:hypothetical protein